MATRAAVISSTPAERAASMSPKRSGGSLMKKLLLVAVASVAGLAVWRKVGPGKPSSQPWASVTDEV
jgi:hypothetical protein